METSPTPGAIITVSVPGSDYTATLTPTSGDRVSVQMHQDGHPVHDPCNMPAADARDWALGTIRAWTAQDARRPPPAEVATVGAHDGPVGTCAVCGVPHDEPSPGCHLVDIPDGWAAEDIPCAPVVDPPDRDPLGGWSAGWRCTCGAVAGTALGVTATTAALAAGRALRRHADVFGTGAW